MTFRCGHPRTPENSHRTGNGYAQCAFCQRARAIAKLVERDQRKINEHRFFTRGERIARGMA